MNDAHDPVKRMEKSEMKPKKLSDEQQATLNALEGIHSAAVRMVDSFGVDQRNAIYTAMLEENQRDELLQTIKDLRQELLVQKCEIDGLRKAKNQGRFGIGDTVMVYDRYRFAIPLAGVVCDFSSGDDGVQVRLLHTNNHNYPADSRVWVHVRQVVR